MIKLAVLHPTLPLYMQQSHQQDSRHMEVVLSSTDFDNFRSEVVESGAKVLVLDLALLGEDPEAAVTQLEQAVSPELTFIVYSFAKWELVERLRRPGRHVMRAPISVRALRSNLIGLIVRQLAPSGAGEQGGAGKPAAEGARLPRSEAPKRLYDDVQLAGLQEIRGTVDCECPNQVADLVLALNAFEQYSLDCENRNEADARIHALLARATGHARGLMEQALTELCAFEQIDVDNLPRRTG